MTLPPAMTEIRESEAPPEIAALYAEIRAATALPQVNLIFRHLATRPGVLAWVWQTLRPLYLSRELSDAVEALAQSLPQPDAPSPIAEAVAGETRRACHRVLDTYNSGNTQNLIGLTAFVHLLDGTTAVDAAPLKPRTGTEDGDVPNRADTAFPPIPRRDELSPDITAHLERLAAHHRTAPGVIPSLYVHLALWPELLPTVDAFLAPRLTQPQWPDKVDALIATTSAFAQHLAAGLTESPAPGIADEDRRQMAATIRTFVNATIPEMVIVGRWLTWDETTI